jgi:predicted  nucleic acid-binding Zn-ribbon protein
MKSNSGFYCQECGHGFRTVKAAEKASFGESGCPKCGGSDIDLGAPSRTPGRRAAIGPSVHCRGLQGAALPLARVYTVADSRAPRCHWPECTRNPKEPL